MKLHLVAKIILLLILLVVQFYILEAFEKRYYFFEDRYLLARERIGNDSLMNIFNPLIWQSSIFASKPAGGLREQKSEAFDKEPLYKEDEIGFRTWNIDYNTKQGKRFLFMGSFSMGYGIGVTVDKTFPSVFYKEFNKMRPSTPIEVINANKGNLILSATLHSIKDVFFTKFKPDVVVIGSFRPPNGYPRNNGQTLEERVFGDRRKVADNVKTEKGKMVI